MQLRGFAGGSRIAAWWFVGLLALGAGAPGAWAQTRSILMSTSGDAATASGSNEDIDDEEILLRTPATSSEPVEFVSDAAWEVLFGDGDGDGMFDDEPSELDALHVPTDLGRRPTAFDAFVSFSADEDFVDGVVVRDGDVVRLRPGTSPEVAYPEARFEELTGTSNVDVDAFALDFDGAMYFSFADSEETSYEVIAAENGGDPVLLDGTIFVVRPGDTFAHLFATEADVLEMVRAALGSSSSSIGDTQGLCADPENPGEILFVVSSTASGLEGTIFSTAGGGTVAQLDGVALEGSGFGFATEEALDAIAVVPAMTDPLRMEIDSVDIPAGASEVELRIVGGTPGGRARVLAAPAALPIAMPIADPRLGGAGYLFLDPSSTLFRNTSRRARFEIGLDGDGSGVFRHPITTLAPGTKRSVQVLDPDTLEISAPATIEIVEP